MPRGPDDAGPNSCEFGYGDWLVLVVRFGRGRLRLEKTWRTLIRHDVHQTSRDDDDLADCVPFKELLHFFGGFSEFLDLLL